jgi:hypothetical protein
MSSSFASVVSSLSPVGYWRLGERSGSTVRDTSTKLIHGTYVKGVILGTPGGIGEDRDTALGLNGRPGFAQIPSHKVYSLTRAWDNFNRVSSPSSSWGNAAGGETWSPTITVRPRYSTDGAHAVINPHGDSGTFEQALPTTLLGGDMQVRANWSKRAVDGALQPVALVAQRIDKNNFIRAELLEEADHTLRLNLIKTMNGVNTHLATAIVGRYASTEHWWYLRFRFDGTDLKARAWKMGTTQPSQWQVQGTASSASVGGIAIRSANSVSSVRPVVRFEGFWTQTLGFSVHLLVRINTGEQTSDPVYFFGKGDKSKSFFSNGNREYHFRYHDSTRDLKAYVFKREGGLGAGSNVPNIEKDRWYRIVMALDSGDALDLTAGITLYVDGEAVDSPTSPGRMYKSTAWAVYPFSGDAPLRLGTLQKDTFLNGALDEVAIFSRKLTPDEVRALYKASL